MPEEIIGDVIVGLAEVGTSMVDFSDNKKKSTLGCLFFVLFGALLCVGLYFIFSQPKHKETHGIITKKLPNDKMVIKTEKGEDIHTINHELYLNKQEGDSIILK